MKICGSLVEIDYQDVVPRSWKRLLKYKRAFKSDDDQHVLIDLNDLTDFLQAYSSYRAFFADDTNADAIHSASKEALCSAAPYEYFSLREN